MNLNNILIALLTILCIYMPELALALGGGGGGGGGGVGPGGGGDVAGSAAPFFSYPGLAIAIVAMIGIWFSLRKK